MSLFSSPESISRSIKRVVILGHSGYVGTHLKSWLASEHSDLETYGLSFPYIDLTDINRLGELPDLLNKETVVVILSGLKKQFGDSLDIFNQNIAMVTNVCRTLDKHPVNHIVFFSSAEVYGDNVDDTELTEDSTVQPASYYGIAKFASEGLLRKLVERDDQGSLLILRPALIYGPNEQQTFYGPTGFVRAMLGDDPITLWGDGEELREFLYIDDLIHIVATLALSGRTGVVNVASGTSRTFNDIAEIIAGVVDTPVEIRSRERTRPKVNQGFHNHRLTNILPDFPFTNLEDGIMTIIEAERLAYSKVDLK